MKYQYTQKCKFCGKEFKCENTRTKYCSEECRKIKRSMRNKKRNTAKKVSQGYGNTCKRRDCKYMSIVDRTCMYILETGVPRGCLVEECDKYCPK